ncbi:YqjF family protein [Haloferula sp.]|uniref:YqjF family protein n=1 Tax=Haloferula sp. TaxID=2497595 RepID=UPI003C785706
MPPTLDQRLALRERPTGFAVMRQRWSKLLFLHWRVDPAILSSKLPAGLHLDLHEGEAWLGIVPFFMERIRPVGLPPVPGLSWFLELNVRTYVHDENDVPGVWFFSLDCNQSLAVEIARSRFHLPYEHAEMSATETDGSIHYDCSRKTESKPASFIYSGTGQASPADPGTLDFFLAERYLLYSARRDGTLYTGRVHHSPYQLSPAHCDTWSTAPAGWDGLPLPDSPPDSTLYVDHVDVTIFPLRKRGG